MLLKQAAVVEHSFVHAVLQATTQDIVPHYIVAPNQREKPKALLFYSLIPPRPLSYPAWTLDAYIIDPGPSCCQDENLLIGKYHQTLP